MVQRLGTQLLDQGNPFRIVGANTYYLAYVDEATLSAALDLVAAFGMNVVRTWAFLDSPEPPGPHGLCFQYWDASAGAPRINDGEYGLVRLDRLIARAGERSLRLILTLTNNWKDFGGMPQYAQWFGLDTNKDRFYTDQRCRDAYQEWVRQVITRRNTITGRLYLDEPAILAWELANEPRCEGWTGTGHLLSWVDEMSRFVRGLDGNHLIAVGDEGYFGTHGVNFEKLLAIENIDFGTYHMYADAMAGNQDPVQFGLDYIRKHCEAAGQTNKPVLLEEYGLKDPSRRNAAYTVWLKAVEDLDALGDLVWMTGLPKSATQPYDPDEYVISAVAAAPAIAAHASALLARNSNTP